MPELPEAGKHSTTNAMGFNVSMRTSDLVLAEIWHSTQPREGGWTGCDRTNSVFMNQLVCACDIQRLGRSKALDADT